MCVMPGPRTPLPLVRRLPPGPATDPPETGVSSVNDHIDAEQLVGAQLVGAGQEKIGKIGQVFLDDQTGTPQWVTVKTGLLGGSESFVPLAGAQLAGEGELCVPYGKDQVKDAPSVDLADGHISEAEEAALYR